MSGAKELRIFRTLLGLSVRKSRDAGTFLLYPSNEAEFCVNRRTIVGQTDGVFCVNSRSTSSYVALNARWDWTRGSFNFRRADVSSNWKSL